MPASTTQSPVDQTQRGKQRLPALLHTTLLLELEMKSSGICSVSSAQRAMRNEDANSYSIFVEI